MTSTNRIGYRELDEAQYLELQTSLLKVKGGLHQRDFLTALKDGEEFLAMIENKVEINDGKTLPTFDGPLTESSFKEPTADLEERMYALWSDAPPSTACRVSFWASVTLEHIRAGKITDATWLAANGRITESGEERIDQALSLPRDESNDKTVDDCVRTVFRRMSGLPAARGNRSVFVNPSFGRGWWRERIVTSILERGETVESRSALLEVVRRNQQYWENLVTMIVSRGSVFGSTDIQAALINSLAKQFRKNPNTPLRAASTLDPTVRRRFSNLIASRELGILPFAEISAIVDDLLDRVQHARSAQ